MMAFVPGGANGYAFQLYLWPCSWWYADLEGSMWEVHRRLSVMMACSVMVSHNWRGQLLSVEHKPLMKWFLKVWMVNLVAHGGCGASPVECQCPLLQGKYTQISTPCC